MIHIVNRTHVLIGTHTHTAHMRENKIILVAPYSVGKYIQKPFQMKHETRMASWSGNIIMRRTVPALCNQTVQLLMDKRF